MNRKQLACRVLFTFAVIGMPENAAIGEAPCACKNKTGAPTLPAFNAFNMAAPQTDSAIMTRLPNSWPRQWAGPTSNGPITTRQRNAASGLATSDQSTVGSISTTKPSNAPANWPSQRIASRADFALTATVPSGPAIGSDAKTSSAFGDNTKSSANGISGFSSSPAYGAGGFGGGGGGGSAGGGSFGGGNSGRSTGGFAGGTTSTPRSSTSAGVGSGGGGFSGGSGSSSGFLSTSQTANDSSSTGSTKTQDSTQTPSPTTYPDPTPTPDPNPGDGGGGGFAEVPPPMCDLPPALPEIPPTGGDPTAIPDFTPGNGVGDTPVVPEPGSIVLLAIGAGVSGGAWLRRRKKLKAATV